MGCAGTPESHLQPAFPSPRAPTGAQSGCSAFEERGRTHGSHPTAAPEWSQFPSQETLAFLHLLEGLKKWEMSFFCMLFIKKI